MATGGGLRPAAVFPRPGLQQGLAVHMPRCYSRHMPTTNPQEGTMYTDQLAQVLTPGDTILWALRNERVRVLARPQARYGNGGYSPTNGVLVTVRRPNGNQVRLAYRAGAYVQVAR